MSTNGKKPPTPNPGLGGVGKYAVGGTIAKKRPGYAAAVRTCEDILADPKASPALKLKAARDWGRLTGHSRNKWRDKTAGVEYVPGLGMPETKRLRESVRREFPDLADTTGDRQFLSAFKHLCEERLYVLAKYVLGMPDLTKHLHEPVCDWLTDFSETRRKLCMLPVVHLKTSICSHAFPLWVLIQPEKANRCFKGMKGCDTRILLHGETVDKASENLGAVMDHLEHNKVFRALWRDLVWPDKKDASLWTTTMLTVRREKIGLAEPTITAVGVGTALEQRHYDVVVIDDIATFDAAQSEVTMNKAKQRRKALRSRLNKLEESIEVGVGTHWTPNDVYIDWKKDPSVSHMVRAAIENEEPIWPERYSLKSLLDMQKEEGYGAVLFSANYMNNPLNSTFTALDWYEVRDYREENGAAVFEWSEHDQDLLDKLTAKSRFPRDFSAEGNSRRQEFRRGMPLSRVYPSRFERASDSPEVAELRKLRHLERKMMLVKEGSPQWQTMAVHAARQRERLHAMGVTDENARALADAEHRLDPDSDLNRERERGYGSLRPLRSSVLHNP